MNGEERQHLSELVSLREYFEAILNEREKALDERAIAQKTVVDAAMLAAKEAVTAALDSAEKAVVTARNAQERVNEKQNEFRQTLVDQNATFLPREAFEAASKETNRRLEQLESVSRNAGGVTQGLGQAAQTANSLRNFLVGFAGVAIATAAVIISIVLAGR